jgi:hypothetical protein
MDDQNFSFHIAEYSSLRQEMYDSLRTRYHALIYCFIANSTVFGWTVSLLDTSGAVKKVLPLAAWLPIIITLSAWLVSIVRLAQIKRIGEYCLLIENKLGLRELGWEKFYSVRKSAIAAHVFTLLFSLQLTLGIYFFLFVAALEKG